MRGDRWWLHLALGVLLLVVSLILDTNRASADTSSGCTPPEAMELRLWEAHRGNICPSPIQQDLFYVFAERGTTFYLEMQSGDRSSLRPYLELRSCCSDDGRILSSSGDSHSWGAWIAYTATYSGNYAIRAGSANGRTGRYWIRVTR